MSEQAKKSRKEQVQELLALDPRDAMLHYMLAMEHAGEGNDEEAVRCFRALLALDPGYVPAYMQGGRALTRLGRDDEARTLFREGVAVATRKGDDHAAGEMSGFLASLDG